MTQKVRPRSTSTIPFGFELHPTNSHLIVEHAKEQEVLHSIRELRQYHSIRKLITYVEAHTGRRLSPRGIQKILKREY